MLVGDRWWPAKRGSSRLELGFDHEPGRSSTFFFFHFMRDELAMICINTQISAAKWKREETRRNFTFPPFSRPRPSHPIFLHIQRDITKRYYYAYHNFARVMYNQFHELKRIAPTTLARGNFAAEVFDRARGIWRVFESRPGKNSSEHSEMQCTTSAEGA